MNLSSQPFFTWPGTLPLGTQIGMYLGWIATSTRLCLVGCFIRSIFLLYILQMLEQSVVPWEDEKITGKCSVCIMCTSHEFKRYWMNNSNTLHIGVSWTVWTVYAVSSLSSVRPRFMYRHVLVYATTILSLYVDYASMHARKYCTRTLGLIISALRFSWIQTICGRAWE